MTTARDAIALGQVALVATDTVYGLAALPGSAGVDDIYRLKGRPRDMALPWLVAHPRALDRYGTDIPDYARTLAETFWPGALTLVVPAAPAALSAGVAQDGTVALRCPDDAELLALIDETGGALCCTSANLHGDPAPSEKAALDESLRGLPGCDEAPDACPGGVASTVVDCTGPFPRVLREGAVPGKVVLDLAVFGDTLHRR